MSHDEQLAQQAAADLTIDQEEKWAPQLGYAEDPEEPLTADPFPSKSGGRPAWLNPEHVLPVDKVMCTICDQPMVLLTQLYTPEDHPPQAFHRTVYVFCCKNGACVKQDWKKCFKVFRSQMGRDNPYYPPPPPEDEDDEDETMAENDDFQPKAFDAPKLCVICGVAGPKACGQCQAVNYCSRQHQLVDWNMCKHKQFCKVAHPSAEQLATIQQLRDARVFDEKEIVSEPEGRGIDGMEEDAQAQFADENDKDEHYKKDASTLTSASGALVPAGEETAEDSKVDVDDAFLRYQLKIQLYPDQVLRYDRVEYDMPDREPLWVHDTDKPASIPACTHCAGPRTFEFQILSTLLNFLGVSHVAADSLDWGSLYIYTCKQNCDLNDNVFMEEYIWKQDFSAHGVNLGPGAPPARS
ncbi:programmed cell death protein 2 [Gongronella butleri]|nr:programmed cell death protein 2 [Gongronella butleri]